jgi:hypothetical protein
VDTPGVIKTNNSLRRNLLVSKAWENVDDKRNRRSVDDNDLTIFVVDLVKRLSQEVRSAFIRLN